MVKTPQTPCPPFQCPPPPQPPCPAVCPPPPPPPACRVKPIMRGLHWAQTTRRLTEGLLLSAFGGLVIYFTYTRPHMERYREFYALSDFEEWADEMAKKGLFQSVPKEGFPKKDKK
ncbi:acrosin-like [Cydia pomonella]|uniref:acrosin-like n=1 Tax=Cydia pomonella TaxID=82600 RepID=UPI002ADD31BE|nr:acrosin-like [Cydia pomonella]XP_061724066.1 acrosin-like [Cydia pomonella]